MSRTVRFRIALRKALNRAPSRRSRLIKIGLHCAVLILALSLGIVALRAASRMGEPEAVAAVSEPTAPAPQNLDELVAFNASVKAGPWKYIVVHHSASTSGSAEIFDRWHRQRGWDRGLGYHFVIGNGSGQGDGFAIAGPRWKNQDSGAHANSAEYNEHGIGICLVGDFETATPSLAQWGLARTLIKKLCKQYNIPPENIYGHNQIRKGGSTACPGKLLDINVLRDAVR